MKKKLTEELEKNLKLINYNRSKILSEQDWISDINSWIDDNIREPIMGKVEDVNDWIDDNFRDEANKKIGELNDKLFDHIGDISKNPRKLLGMSEGDVKWMYNNFVHPVKAIFTPGYLQTPEGRVRYPDMSLIDRVIINKTKEMNQWMRSDDSILPSILLNLAYLASRANPYMFIIVSTYDILEVNAYMEPTEENPNGDWFMGGILAFMAITNINDFLKAGGFADDEIKQLRAYKESLGKSAVKEGTQTKWQKFLADPLVAKKLNAFIFREGLKKFIKEKFPVGLKQIAQLIIFLVSKGYLLSSFLLRIAIKLVGSVVKSILGIAAFAIPWYIICRIFKLPGVPTFDAPLQQLTLGEYGKNGKPTETNQIPLVATVNTIATVLLKNNKVFSPSTVYEPEIELFQYFFEKIYPTEPDYLQNAPRYVYNGKSKKINFYNLDDIKNVNIYTVYGKNILNQKVSESSLSLYISKLSNTYLSGLLLIELKSKNNKSYVSKFFPQYDSQNIFQTSEGQEYELGIYNKNFESTVISFQKRNDLSVDGRLGSKTLTKMIEICNSKKEIFIEDETNLFSKIQNKYDNIIKKDNQELDEKIKKNQEELEALLNQAEMNEKERQRIQDSIANSYKIPQTITDDDLKKGSDFLDSIMGRGN